MGESTKPSNQLRSQYSRYDVRAASEQYSNIATVLAGFAFAAIVLVVQQPLPDGMRSAIPDLSVLRDWAIIAFLLAFFGCMVSAFTFAVVAAEEKLVYRADTMALLGGGGLAVSTIYVLWGLVLLVKLYLPPTILALARSVFVVALLIAPLYLILSAIDPYILAFDNFGETQQERAKFVRKIVLLLGPAGYAPLFVGGLELV